MTSTITTLKKFDTQHDTVSFRNNTFKQVTFWGRIARVLLTLICKDGFKDCQPVFITKTMVRHFNKEFTLLNSAERRTLHRRITVYAKKYNTQKYLAHLISPTSKKNVSQNRNTGSSLSLNSNLSSSAFVSIHSNNLSSSVAKKEIDWGQAIKDCCEKKITPEDLVEYVKTYSLSNLSPDQAVQVYSLTSNDLRQLDILDFNLDQRGALNLYLIRKLTQKSIDIKGATWQEVISYTGVPNDVLPEYLLKEIVAKSTKNIKPKEALIIAERLYLWNKVLAKQFTAKLTSMQIREIVKKYSTSSTLQAYVKGTTLYKLCAKEYHRSYLSAFLKVYSYQLDEHLLLPDTPQEIWQDIFLEVELESDEVLLIAKKIVCCATFSQDLMRSLLQKSLKNANFNENMKKLRALGTQIHSEGVSSDIEEFVIPLLKALSVKR